MLITVMIYGLVSTFKAYAFTTEKRQIAIDANLAIERMVREIRQASSVDTGVSSFGVNPGVLLLNSTDATGNPKSVKFSVVNDVISITENNILTGGITSGLTKITNLTFTKLTSLVGTAIKIDLTVQDTHGSTTTTASFHDTAVMRGVY